MEKNGLIFFFYKKNYACNYNFLFYKDNKQALNLMVFYILICWQMNCYFKSSKSFLIYIHSKIIEFYGAKRLDFLLNVP